MEPSSVLTDNAVVVSMKGSFVIIRERLSVVLLLLFLTACAGTPKDPTLSWSVEKLYAEAREEMSNLQYEKAIPLFEKLEGRAAGTPLAQQAQLEKAYALFKNKDTALALATLNRYIKIHPASPALDYALYLKGLINFNDDIGLLEKLSKQDLADRDQQASRQSFQDFKELVARFPDSKYSADARLRMNHMLNTMARYELIVARYYHRRQAYVAAVNRLQTVIQEFSGSFVNQEALELLVDCYDKQGLNQLRDDTRRILQLNYPNANQPKPQNDSKSWWRLW